VTAIDVDADLPYAKSLTHLGVTADALWLSELALCKTRRVASVGGTTIKGHNLLTKLRLLTTENS
jgi:hypothetical protein